MSATVIAFPQPSGRSFEPWVDWKKVAAHFDVSRSTVKRWTEKGMPSSLLAGRRRYRLSECEDWLKGAA